MANKKKPSKKDGTEDLYKLMEGSVDPVEKLFRNMRSLPRRPNYEKYLNRDGIFRVKVEFKPRLGFIDSSLVLHHYYTLIKEKTCLRLFTFTLFILAIMTKHINSVIVIFDKV